jgi:multidrug resistance efflux pump
MRENRILDLADCTEFRQTLLARPPRIVHGTAILLILLLSTAILWSAMTKADLVVRTAGRVRPVNTPIKIFNAGRGEVFSASAGSRVVEVHFHVGDEVRRGDVLIRLDTGRLDSEIARRKRAIRTSEEELVKIRLLSELLTQQFAAVRSKAAAERTQAEEEVRQSQKRRTSDVRLAELELAAARDDEERIRQLARQQAAAATDLVKATTRLREAKEKLEKARIPVDQSRVEITRQALALAEKDYVVKREELALKQAAKQGEIESSREELKGLELERRQATLRAPQDGVVTRGDVKVGDLLEPGKPVVEIAEQKGYLFEVAVSTEEAAHLRIGMPARIRLDAYDYQKYGTLTGRVRFVSPDSELAEGQQTARYLVRIELESDQIGRGEFHGQVKLGMAGQAEILTDHESILGLLVKRIRQTISLG